MRPSRVTSINTYIDARARAASRAQEKRPRGSRGGAKEGAGAKTAKPRREGGGDADPEERCRVQRAKSDR